MDTSNTTQSSYISGGFTTTDFAGCNRKSLIHVYGVSRTTQQSSRLAQITQSGKRKSKPKMRTLDGSWEVCLALLTEACDRLSGIPDSSIAGRARLEAFRAAVLNLTNPNTHPRTSKEFNAIAAASRLPGYGSWKERTARSRT